MKNVIVFLLLQMTISINLFSQWEVKHVDEENYNTLYSLKFYDSELGFAMGVNGTILKSVDEGETWEKMETDITGIIKDFEFISADTLLLISSDYVDGETIQKIYKTTDGGENWDQVYQINEGFECIHFLNKEVGFIAGKDKIRKTNNSGDSWSMVYNMLTDGYEWGTISDLEMLNDAIGFAVGIGKVDSDEWEIRSTLLKTIDGGETWDEIHHSPDWLHQLEFVNQELGFVSGYDNNFRTTDGGITWDTLSSLPAVEDISAPSANTIYTVSHPQAYIGDAPSTVFAISKSTDSGDTWDGEFSNGAHLETVFFQNDSVGFVAGDYSIIMKTENGGGEIIGDYPWHLFTTSTNEIKATAIEFYPNPTRDKLFFKELDYGQEWKFLIESLNGQIIKKGTINNMEIDVSGIPPGMYVLILQNANLSKAGKFIKF